MTDSAILPLPQKHQTDHNNGCYGHRDHQQANQCAAAEAEVLSQGPIGLLTGWNGGEEDREQQWDITCAGNHWSNETLSLQW